MAEVVLLPLAELDVPEALSPRSGLDPATRVRYAAALRDPDAAALPPVDLFELPDGRRVVAGGRYRLAAYADAFGTDARVPCRVRPGTWDDAVLFALGDNGKHGRGLSNRDIPKAVALAAAHPVLREWDDGKLANYLGLDRRTVAKHRVPGGYTPRNSSAEPGGETFARETPAGSADPTPAQPCLVESAETPPAAESACDAAEEAGGPASESAPAEPAGASPPAAADARPVPVSLLARAIREAFAASFLSEPELLAAIDFVAARLACTPDADDGPADFDPDAVPADPVYDASVPDEVYAAEPEPVDPRYAEFSPERVADADHPLTAAERAFVDKFAPPAPAVEPGRLTAKRGKHRKSGLEYTDFRLAHAAYMKLPPRPAFNSDGGVMRTPAGDCPVPQDVKDSLASPFLWDALAILEFLKEAFRVRRNDYFVPRDLHEQLASAAHSVRRGVPYALCPACGARPEDTVPAGQCCPECYGGGLVPEWFHCTYHHIESGVPA